MKRCPSCDHTRAYELSDGRRKCRQCGQRYTWTSVWESVRLPAKAKGRLVEMFSLGVPVFRQRFNAPASAPTMERFYRLCRACCAWEEDLREPFEGMLECDETTFGGRRKGKRGWGAAGKVIVFGIVKRNGRVIAKPIDTRTKASVLEKIEAHTREGSLYYTDEWQAYATLHTRGEHVMIRKAKGKPAGRDHINGIEGFWSYAKHWLSPYRGVPAKYFHLYLAEVCWRYNHRDEDLRPLIKRHLTYLSTSQINPILVRSA